MSEILVCPTCDAPVIGGACASCAPKKEHCPRRLMGEHQEPHMPCDTGDFSRDGEGEDPAKALIEARARLKELETAYLNKIADNDRLRDEISRHAGQRSHWSGVVGKSVGEKEELRTTLAAAESKIAALKVDLAGMQKERDEAAQERDHSLLLSGDISCMETDKPGCGYCNYCLRAQLELVIEARDEACANVARLTARVHELQDQCIAKEGEVRAVREEIARLREENEHHQAALTIEVDAHAVTKAVLGRAVGALAAAWDHHCGGEHHPCEHDYLDGEVDAIIADPTSTQAGEAWRANEKAWSVVDKCLRAIERIVNEGPPGVNVDIEALTLEALAAVDARRGGGGGQ